MWNLSDPIPPEPKPEEIYPPCLDCNGEGMIRVRILDFLGDTTEDYFPCRSCDGKGYIEPEEDEEIPY